MKMKCVIFLIILVLILIHIMGMVKILLANTIPCRWNGNVEKILEYYPKKHKYKVQFVIPGEEPYIDIIPASYLRGAVPTRMSKLEKEFFDT